MSKTMKFPVRVHVDMSVPDPLPEDAIRLLPRKHHLRSSTTANVWTWIPATVEVKIKAGAPLAANLEDVRGVHCELVEPDDDDESETLLQLIWEELAQGHGLEIKILWPSDEKLREYFEEERRNRRWKLERDLVTGKAKRRKKTK